MLVPRRKIWKWKLLKDRVKIEFSSYIIKYRGSSQKVAAAKGIIGIVNGMF